MECTRLWEQEIKTFSERIDKKLKQQFMIHPGFLIGKIGTLIIWSFKGFKGKFGEVESQYHNYNHIVGFLTHKLIS